jgi:hypothetical protein
MATWHELTDRQRRALTVVMESWHPVQACEIIAKGHVTLLTVNGLIADGLIEWRGTGYVATPSGLLSFHGCCEIESRKAKYPNGGMNNPQTGCQHAGECQIRRIVE